MNNGSTSQCNKIPSYTLISFKATSDIKTSPSANWDMQLNAYSPNGFTSALMQFVMAVTTSGMVQWSIEYWPAASGSSNLFNTCSQNLYQLPQQYLPNGWKLEIKLMEDSNQNINEVWFYVVDAYGLVQASQDVPLDSTLPICSGSWSNSYLAPIVDFAVDIVGYNGGATVDFVSGTTATLYYYNSQVIFNWGTSFLSCVQTTNTTEEKSNMNYGTPASSGGQLVQSCSA